MEEGDDGVAYYSQDFEWNELRDEVGNLQDVDDGAMDSTQNHVGSQAAWEKFHGRHSQGLFFKERRYLLKEFPELGDTNKEFRVLEIGCGAGSSIAPILRANSNARVYACDLSEAALKITNKIAERVIPPDQAKSRLSTFHCDPSIQPLPTWLACESCRASGFSHKDLSVHSNLDTQKDTVDNNGNGFPLPSGLCCEKGVDFITMIFTLSAVPFERMLHLLKECYAVLRPGGMVFFRDYGLYDMTMLRFPHTQKVGEGCYRRLDGTLSYFFSCEGVRDLFTAAGFVEDEIQYCCIKLLNRKKKVPMKRVWVHARFIKPGSSKII